MKNSGVPIAFRNKALSFLVALFMLSGCSLAPAPANPNAKPRPAPSTTEQREEGTDETETGDENATARTVLNKPSKTTPTKTSAAGGTTEESQPTTCADVHDTVDSSQSEPPQNALQTSDRNNGYKGRFIGDGRRNCWKSGRCDVFGNPKNKCDARKSYFGLSTDPTDFSVVDVPPEVPSNCGCTLPTK